MSINAHPPTTTEVTIDLAKSRGTVAGETSQVQQFIRSAIIFVFVGVLIYLALYLLSEQLIYSYAKRNRFFNVKTAPVANYDYAILGASHAAALDYQDMTQQLEQKTNSKIINLSEVGSGVTVNRLILDYFLASHRARNVIYVIDSFAFYSPQWNEERFNDTRLFDRAPFDPTLAQILIQNPAGRGAALNYILGFSKINNADRFKPDISDDEATKFERTYRPVKQIDTQRLAYLYPKEIDPAISQRYLSEFEDLLRYLQQQNIRLVVIKPPVPTRYYQMLPGEAQFDEELKAVLTRNNVEFHDFSLVANDEKFYFNTDHLNKAGVLNFFDNYLKQVLAR